MSKTRLLRLVVPAYNEARNLPELCERLKGVLMGENIPYELYIVDDGSRDGTQEAVKALSSSHPIHVVTHPVNRGIAAVFLSGLRAAAEKADDDDPIAVLEGDGTSSPEILPKMLRSLTDSCDVVIASRYARGGGYRNFPFQRLMLSLGANILLRWVCRIPGVRDYTIFYRVYRAGPLRRALEAHGDRFTSAGGFACNAEMLLRLKLFVREVREVALLYDYGRKKGKSSMRIFSNLRSYLKLFRISHAESGGKA
ncbi:MAG: glycosyltransferase [Elusimicrobiota bacterium]|jgi:dolichol-phosphate mannosyltransferase